MSHWYANCSWFIVNYGEVDRAGPEPYVDGLLREVVQLPDRFGYPQESVSKHDIPDLYLPPELHMALRAS